MVDADEAMKRAADAIGDCIHDGCSAWNVIKNVIQSLESSGWVCVPREATEEMCAKGYFSEPCENAVLWGHMISTAPRLTGEKR